MAGGLKDLSSLAMHASPDAAAAIKELQDAAADKARGIKRRRGPGYGLPCADNLEALRSVWEGFEAAAAAVQRRLAERESSVTVREVACCSVEARLAHRSAQLEEWESRLRARAGALEQVQASLQEAQERARGKGVLLHEDTDSDLEAAEVPAGAGFWAPSQQQQQGQQHPQQQLPQQQQQQHAEPEPQFKGFWADSTQYGTMTPEQQHQQHSPMQMPTQHSATPGPTAKLHFAALEADSEGRPRVGVRLVSTNAPTPTNSANSLDSQSHGSADTAAVHSRLHQAAAAAAHAPPSPHAAADAHVELRTGSVSSGVPKAAVTGAAPVKSEGPVGVPSKLGMKLAKMEGQGVASPWHMHQQQPSPQQHQHSLPVVPPLFQAMVSDGEQKLDSLAEAAEVVEHGSVSHQHYHHHLQQQQQQRGRSPVRGLARLPEEAPIGAEEVSGEADAVAGPYVKALDYKSCDHILCLTKDMARELFPPAPHSSAGGPSQATVELEDDSGRTWQMTYRCVPHRYSYELRAGWKAFAHFWNVGVGDTVVLWRDPPPRSALRISIRAPTAYAPCPAAATRHGAARAALY